MIDYVQPQSPAAHAGLLMGDIVTAANGVLIKNPSQFRNLIGFLPVGSEVDLRYRRGAETLTTTVRIEAPRQTTSAERTNKN